MPRAICVLLILAFGIPLPLALGVTHPAAPVDFFPPAPDSRAFIRAVMMKPYCTVTGASVKVEGKTITVEILSFAGGCIATWGSEPMSFDIGVLPPGVYQVVFRAAPPGLPGVRLPDPTTLTVRQDAPVIVSPVGGPTDGSQSVQIYAASLGPVLFDGLPVTVSQQNGALMVTPPPHAAGTVDVTVAGQKATAAYTYYDPAAPPDPSVFEPVLFPVAYDGAGAFGSLWTTRNFVATRTSLVRFREPVPTKTCSGNCGNFLWSGVLAPQSHSGLLVWAVRRRFPTLVEDDFQVSTRVVDLSRPHGNGTMLPVARERDFRGEYSIHDVPVGGNARVLMRLYSIDRQPVFFYVSVSYADGTFEIRLVPGQQINGIGFATVEITAPAGQPAAPARIWIHSGIRSWALVTVTDNATQEVTAFWPQ